MRPERDLRKLTQLIESIATLGQGHKPS